MANRQVLLVSRPSGIAQAENFAIREVPIEPLAEGSVLVRNEFLSVEPAMRGWIADVGNYSTPVPSRSVRRWARSPGADFRLAGELADVAPGQKFTYPVAKLPLPA